MIEIDLTALPEVTNDKFYRLYNDPSRYLVLMGGGGSGKSVFAAQKIIYRMLTETDHRFLVLRKVKDTLRQSVFAELKGVIDDWGMSDLFQVPKGSSSSLYIKCLNGNEILFAGLDDVEKLKSIRKITSIWIEEASEILPEDFRQLDIRLRHKTKHYKQMILSFNPVSVTHWLKTEFFDRKKPNATVIHSTYKDNRFLSQEAIDVLEAFKETDPYYYMVYALGEWGVIGKTVFNAQLVTNRLMKIRDNQPVRGSFVFTYENERIIDDSIRFVKYENGPLAIYEMPEPRYPYVIGGDTAEGGHDSSVGQVRNNITWNQAAVWRDQTDTDLYAKQMYCLGRFYNTALIGIETNFDLHPVKELQRLGYEKLYIRESMDSYTGEVQKKYGFNTSRVTRPVIIANYVALVRESIDKFNDVTTLEEMLTFVRDEKGRPAAQEGKHDDTILADAIALQIRDQQSFKLLEEPVVKKETPFPFRTEPDDGEEFMQW